MAHRLKAFTLIPSLILMLMLSTWLLQSHWNRMRTLQLIEIKLESNSLQYEVIQLLSEIHKKPPINGASILEQGWIMRQEDNIYYFQKNRFTIIFNSNENEVNVIWSN